ncbi:uncharacterized protein LOC116619983 isoform X2 [Nematostella vectensis]|uniref:uncharacterized protein LOC116619983 isoform X1 n=1 Tax=Nematostella vectensis TaxID=45351 RepID=UPI0020771507|nr:uncharacterized protein LOC116619983 isoform X1 [Nematostella vectensis]XP_048578751.1 uncharacterized protein LOC116619983 isoform X2 [Nematostella vectensis]
MDRPLISNSSVIHYSYAYTGCFGTYNSASCVRDSSLAFLACVTCLICVFKVFKLHSHHHSLPNQYIIYYSGIINCILCGLNWIYLSKTAVHFITQFLKTTCQVLVVTHFHCLLAARMTRQEDNIRLWSVPSLILLVIYMLVTCIVGLSTMTTEYHECYEPEWLLMSCMEFVIVQIFLAAGLIIVRELNNIHMQETDRTTQKRDLWGIIFVFEISSAASVIHDIVMAITGPTNLCQGVFVNTAVGYTSIYITVKIVQWLLPLWAIAAIFGIENNDWSEAEQRVPVYINAHDSGNFTSEFRPRGTSFNYKHLYEHPQAPLMPSQGRATSLPGIASSYGTMGKNILGQSPKTQSGEAYPPI